MSWLSKTLRFVDNVLKGSGAVEREQMESQQKVVFTDSQGREYIQRAKDGKIKDPLTGMWLDYETFKYLFAPGLIYNDMPEKEVFQEIYASPEFTERQKYYVEKLLETGNPIEAGNAVNERFGNPGQIAVKSENNVLLILGGLALAIMVIR